MSYIIWAQLSIRVSEKKVIFACCEGDGTDIEFRGWPCRVLEFLTVAVFLRSSLSLPNMYCVRKIFSPIWLSSRVVQVTVSV